MTVYKTIYRRRLVVNVLFLYGASLKARGLHYIPLLDLVIQHYNDLYYVNNGGESLCVFLRRLLPAIFYNGYYTDCGEETVYELIVLFDFIFNK